MRRLPFVANVLVILVVPVSASALAPPTGGASPPTDGGGITYGEPLRSVRPIATEFRVNPKALVPGGEPATFTYRIDGVTRSARVRIDLLAAGVSAPVKQIRLGYKRIGRRHRSSWTPRPGELAAGELVVALHAVDSAGRALRRTASASGRGALRVQVTPPPLSSGGVFPVAGPHSLGGEESRFGAARHGHVHQGHDISAPVGTPVVAPRASFVQWVAFQADGAGHYVVLRGDDGRDYVFMHLAENSIGVGKGAAVAAGQPFAAVGSTGSSSGPHLHFEIWPHGWFASPASVPIDPLPDLLAWSATR